MTGKLTMVLIVCHAFFWKRKEILSWAKAEILTHNKYITQLHAHWIVPHSCVSAPRRDHKTNTIIIDGKICTQTQEWTNKDNALPYTRKLPIRREKKSHTARHRPVLSHTSPSVSESQSIGQQMLNEHTHAHRRTFKFPWDMHISCLSLSATLPFPENFSIASWLAAFPESAGKSFWDTCTEGVSRAGHGAHPGPSAPTDSSAVEPTPGHKFSYSLPPVPNLLLFNKAGHCSGNLWLQLPGYRCRQTGKQNSCSQRAAECSVTKAGEKKK